MDYVLLYMGVLLKIIATAGAQNCTDQVDSSVCRLLASESFGVKDLCTDPCLAQTCRKTCGKCPLDCYQCHSVSSPAECHTTTTCPSQDHHCVVTESYNDNFEKVFQLGCALKNICQSNFVEVNGKRSNLLGACCQSDLCNNNVSIVQNTPQSTTGIILTTPTTSKSSAPIVIGIPSATLSSNTCADVNGDLCTQLAFTMPDICANDCLASKVCPGMCGKCLSCFQCDHVQQPQDCLATSTCNPDETCFIAETVDSITFQRGYRLGCIDAKFCTNLTSAYGNQINGVAPVIGRRDHFHFSLDGDCCGSDLCNDRVQTTRAPMTTTPTHTTTPVHTTRVPGSPTPFMHKTTTTASSSSRCQWSGHCPQSFFQYNGNCYHFGRVPMEWDQALGYCKEKCSHLAELKTDYQLQTVMNHFRHDHQHNTGYFPYQDYFIGAVYKDGARHWVWYNSGDQVDSDLIPPYHNGNQCAIVMNLVHAFGLGRKQCNRAFRPMCEVRTANTI